MALPVICLPPPAPLPTLELRPISLSSLHSNPPCVWARDLPPASLDTGGSPSSPKRAPRSALHPSKPSPSPGGREVRFLLEEGIRLPADREEGQSLGKYSNAEMLQEEFDKIMDRVQGKKRNRQEDRLSVSSKASKGTLAEEIVGRRDEIWGEEAYKPLFK